MTSLLMVYFRPWDQVCDMGFEPGVWSPGPEIWSWGMHLLEERALVFDVVREHLVWV